MPQAVSKWAVCPLRPAVSRWEFSVSMLLPAKSALPTLPSPSIFGCRRALLPRPIPTLPRQHNRPQAAEAVAVVLAAEVRVPMARRQLNLLCPALDAAASMDRHAPVVQGAEASDGKAPTAQPTLRPDNRAFRV